MSLLMDALRRAEEEKSNQPPEAEATETQAANAEFDFAVAPVEPAAAGSDDVTVQVDVAAVQRASAAADVHDATPALGPMVSGLDGDSAGAFKAADADATDFGRVSGLPDKLELEPLDAIAGATDTAPADQAADVTGASTTGVNARVEQTQTLPSSRALQNDLNAYFAEPQSVETAGAMNRGDVTLEDVAAHTVVGAQTVFKSGERPRSRRVLIVAVAIAAVLVLGIGLVGLFYAQQSPGPRYVPPPTVADGIERPILRELPNVPLEPGPSKTVNELARVDTIPPPPEAASGTASPAEPETRGSALARSDSASMPPLESRPPIPTGAEPDQGLAHESPAPRIVDPRSTATVTIAQAARKAASRPTREAEVGIGAGELRIARTARPLEVDMHVKIAYAAFKSGDLDRAAQHYHAQLGAKPEHRDALLGLGAVALARGDLASAYQHYAAALDAHPADPVATAALLGLTRGGQGRHAARLRVMLDQHRDAPYLHFALGSWYARQGRWGDAQQAYFDAMRLDAENPDYAFNHAVSLDHIGQSAAALEYYRKSLSLLDADAGAGNFNPANVLNRINELSSTASTQ